MAVLGFCTVIYIIIDNKMKTSPISTNPNQSHIPAQVRSALTLIGIVTAIICSLVFLQDVYSAENVEAGSLRSMDASKVVNVEMVAKAASIVWELK